ncbi:Arm DNA-binding domain-containing protein [Sulfuriferula multivorans]|uniref:Arm DNA-binding domain-containing protein n=1 Tax=Sulfuriferula multivorans TaxID=1559896 RepID=UPI00351DBE94
MLGASSTWHLLSARQVDTQADGGNLYLKAKGDVRSWVFRYKQADKVREIGMSATHTHTLAEVRDKTEQMCRSVSDGTELMATCGRVCWRW